MTTPDAVSYLQWKKDVEHHDYAAASTYLSIRFGESRAQKVAEDLQKLPVITRRANDILRHRARPTAAVGPGHAQRPEESAGRGEAVRFSWRRAISRTATTGSPSPTRSTRTRRSRSS
jgi:hypothetical protein